MNHKAIKLGVTVAVLATAFGALLYTSISENLQYYKFVDEVMAEPHVWEGKPLRVHGYVVAGSITRSKRTREYRFDVQRNGKMIRASFIGSPPDAFKDDAEVVLTGVLDKDRFVATQMDAKCPSKYEEAAGKSPRIVAWLGEVTGT